MIQHVVLINFRAGVPHEVRMECFRRLQDLPSAIPSLTIWRVGLNVTTAGRAWDLGLVAEFTHIDDVIAYRNEGAHRATQRFIDEYAAETVGIDFEFTAANASGNERA